MRLPLPLLLWLLLPSSAFAEEADVRVLHAGDDTMLRVEVIGVTDRARVELLQGWIAEVARMQQSVAGRFPLRSAEVRIRQVDGRQGDGRDANARDPSPVPWGQTLRRDGVAVLLYVRQDATLAQLRDDWTAVHELSHLFHPYLGERGRWLAEGLASYYQNVLRARAGLLTEAEAWRRLDGGFQRGRAAVTGVPLDELGRQRGGTMRVYWAGAAYWLEADLALRGDRGSTLDTVLSAYARCCLASAPQGDPQSFVKALDKIAGGKIFASLFLRYATSTTFPSLDTAYRRLGIHATNNRLQFSGAAAAARLRQSVMGAQPVPATAAEQAIGPQ